VIAPDVPPAFEPLERVSRFNDLVGPLYMKREERDVIIGLRVADKHRNRRDIVHGGMICTLADFAMGMACSLARDPELKVVTTSLSVDFAGNARPGDWIEARVDLLRVGRRMAFANCHVWRDAERIAQASGAFLVLGERE
jgi:uncharacterized protein (TIGR00369 family)